jgi:transposase-like protein
MSIAGCGCGRKKKARVLGEPRVLSDEEFAGMKIDTKMEIIKALIPLGLNHIGKELDAEVKRLAGTRYAREDERTGVCRYGKNRSSVRLGGQHVPINAPRVRNVVENREVPLKSLEAARSNAGETNETLLRRVLYGLSCHNYEAVAEAIPGAIGLSASTVSREFIRASAAKLRELQERDLSKFDFVAMVLDGKTFAEDMLVAALGITLKGDKIVLGLVQASTENAKVLTAFLQSLVDRGLKIESGILTTIDGGKGLRTAIRRVFGKKAFVQRCQWHKRENVLQYMSKTEQPWLRKRLQQAYERPTYAEAKAALKEIRRDLSERNLSAVKSLDEGFEETLTLHRLGVFPLVGISLKTTNCLESIFGLVEARVGRVCSWKNSSQKQRWLASCLLEIEPRLRKIKGHRHLGRLREAMERELQVRGRKTGKTEDETGSEKAA